jgi:hypothetical protein
MEVVLVGDIDRPVLWCFSCAALNYQPGASRFGELATAIVRSLSTVSAGRVAVQGVMRYLSHRSPPSPVLTSYVFASILEPRGSFSKRPVDITLGFVMRKDKIFPNFLVHLKPRNKVSKNKSKRTKQRTGFHEFISRTISILSLVACGDKSEACSPKVFLRFSSWLIIYAQWEYV